MVYFFAIWHTQIGTDWVTSGLLIWESNWLLVFFNFIPLTCWVYYNLYLTNVEASIQHNELIPMEWFESFQKNKHFECVICPLQVPSSTSCMISEKKNIKWDNPLCVKQLQWTPTSIYICIYNTMTGMRDIKTSWVTVSFSFSFEHAMRTWIVYATVVIREQLLWHIVNSFQK